IVDDDEEVRRALRRLLRSLSYQAASFSSGEAFLASLAETRPDCALMDQHMPGMTGLEVFGRLGADGHLVTVVIVTGFDQPGLHAKCLEAGAVGYLLKPVDGAAIEAAIGRMLQFPGSNL